MYRLDPDTGKQKFFAKDGTKSVISAVISILIGMVVGTLIIIFVMEFFWQDPIML